MPPAGRARYCLRRGLSRGFAPNPTNECQGRCPRHPHPLLKKRDQNFSTEKFLRCEQSAVNIEYSVFARPAWILFGALFMLFSGLRPEPCEDASGGESLGASPRTPQGCLRRAGRRPAPVPAHLAGELMKKRDQNFSTEKFLRCEQSAVNTEYSVSARPAIRKGRLNLFASNRRKVSGFAETITIKYAFALQKRTS